MKYMSSRFHNKKISKHRSQQSFVEVVKGNRLNAVKRTVPMIQNNSFTMCNYENDSRCSLCFKKSMTHLFLNLSPDPQLKNKFQLKQQNLKCDDDIQSSPTASKYKPRGHSHIGSH